MPSGMNESDLQKAYSALGLPYQGSPGFGNNPQQGHLPNNAVRLPNQQDTSRFSSIKELIVLKGHPKRNEHLMVVGFSFSLMIECNNTLQQVAMIYDNNK